ncbi:hypothetical protein [Mocis latipes granulovirus]|uniref:Uncharacterized protein n=1 Tax=Mocis latipes granulovirus TaxID=2072024 RepID=A0A162GVG3_9BBAC|nr:hypothetical protein [Mocis latipes granulovirus]AKR17418.1 hypothetical protein [Mocis latipes granulovirus]
MVCVYCKKNLNALCPLCKTSIDKCYMLTARKTESDTIPPGNNVAVKKVNFNINNKSLVNRVYEVFEMLPHTTVYHVNKDFLYCNTNTKDLELVEKILKFENGVIHESEPKKVFISRISKECKLVKKIDKLAYKNRILTVKMLKYKLKYLKQVKKYNKLL